MFKKALVIACVVSLLATPAMARPWQGHDGGGRHLQRHSDHGHPGYGRPVYRNYVVRHGVLPWYGYGFPYRGYRHRYYVDDDVFPWLGLTAIGLTALNVLSYEQQRRFEEAHWQAANTPIGRTITWREGQASGAVTPLREGFADGGQYCREFQQEVRIGGRTERAWGTACLGEDGSWKITR